MNPDQSSPPATRKVSPATGAKPAQPSAESLSVVHASPRFRELAMLIPEVVGDIDRVIAEVAKEPKVDPIERLSHFEAGYLLRKALGDTPEASVYYRKALNSFASADNPHSRAQMHLCIAEFCAGQGDRAHAVRAIDTAVSLVTPDLQKNSNIAVHLQTAAVLYTKFGERRKAAAAIRRIAKEQMLNSDGRADRGSAWIAVAKVNAELHEHRRALKCLQLGLGRVERFGTVVRHVEALKSAFSIYVMLGHRAGIAAVQLEAQLLANKQMGAAQPLNQPLLEVAEMLCRVGLKPQAYPILKKMLECARAAPGVGEGGIARSILEVERVTHFMIACGELDLAERVCQELPPALGGRLLGRIFYVRAADGAPLQVLRAFADKYDEQIPASETIVPATALAAEAFFNARWEEGLRLCERAPAEDLPELRLSMALAHAQLGHFVEARELLRQHRKNYSSNPWIRWKQVTGLAFTLDRLIGG